MDLTPRSSITTLDATRSSPAHASATGTGSKGGKFPHNDSECKEIHPRHPRVVNHILHTAHADPNMVTWDGPDDPMNPQNWPNSKKWVVTVVSVNLALSVSFASSAPTSAFAETVRVFNINSETAYTIVTVFLLGFAIGPTFWGPGSELYGRRPVILGAMFAYILFHLGQALAHNIQSLLVCRFFSGFFGVAPLAVDGGIFADIWPAIGRGPAASLFATSVFLGPVLGPLVGGFIASSSVTWRWIYWVMMMFAGACTAIAVIFLPETNASVKRLRKEDPENNADLFAEHEIEDWSIKGIAQRTLYRPFKMLMLEPILVLVTIYISVVYSVLYALFEAIPIIFVETRGFTLGENGLIFIGIGIGTTLGAIINILCSLHYPELVHKWKGYPPPEERLYGAMIGAPCLIIGAFWLGWTGQYESIKWYVPAISTIFIGVSISLIFMSFLSYLLDVYLIYAASAFAANTIMRSLIAASFPLFTVQMYHNLGINWASTLIGLIGVVLAPSPFLFYKFGKQIRKHSKFAPCIDLEIEKQLELEATQGEKAV
ncbi:MFS general substrate transporter [Guyanagaster necrorhizus]|uniref:MFS general substrate transporter n=1 Tax=Guyanagaster necrorhizus TaxID=856835 RepID=A0A9P8AX58_9AGAR|nr:MFS general substrate transporter [Guyanagaster necrorhizus MCA 3950]KAG7450861.1 MFS general substrate transporter [Guyanagaster necrorhizus MCA 3950]